MQLQHLITGTSCTLYLFRHVICVLTTRYYVLQSVSVLDPIYVILMNARVTRLMPAGAHMAYIYPTEAALVGRHETDSSTTLFSYS